MSCLEQVKQNLSALFKVILIRGKLFVDDKYIVEISVLGRNSIIVCDTIFYGKRYTTYMISVKENKIPRQIIERLISCLQT